MTNQTTDGVGAPNLPPLPKKRRAFICTKCGSQECKAGEEALMHPPCAKCDYLGFAQDCDYNDAEVQAYALEALRLASPQGWVLEHGTGGFEDVKWISIRHLESQCGQDFYADRDPLIFGFLRAMLAAAPEATK